MRRERVRDTLLRVAGVVALAACWLLMSWLFRSTGVNQQALAPLQFAAAAAGFLCFSIGAALTVLGGHIVDQIELSHRWASRARRDGERRAGDGPGA